MAAVVDTTPLNYLVLTGNVEIFPKVCGQVIVPDVVLRQLQHHRTPESVRNWAKQPPSWLELRSISGDPDPQLLRLHSGEREAIMIAEQLRAEFLVVDERAAAREAKRRGVQTIGTLGLLSRAAEHGWVDFDDAIERLKRTTFRMTDALLESFRDRHRSR